MLAAEHTERTELGTAIAVAFARSPMQLAYTAHDLQAYSGGRFILGLGSQVKPHIERRFGMPWSYPAPRMREFVLALRAIWSAWNDGTRLSFRGDFYQHTLMTPFFSPPPAPGGAPGIFLAAVGEAMTAVAGEVADGLLVHAFTTERYLREVTLPALDRGLAAAGRSRADAEVSLLAMIATGRSEEEMARAVAGTRAQIAFYGSTPAYRAVLGRHGWAGLGDELNALSRSDRGDKWEAMGGLIDDDVLHAFAVVAEPAGVAAQIRRRFGGLIDRVLVLRPLPDRCRAVGPHPRGPQALGHHSGAPPLDRLPLWQYHASPEGAGMDRLERREFVRKHRTCIFGYNRRSDGPAMTVVYYVLDGDDLLISTMAARGKALAVQRQPKVSLCILDEQWPLTYLQVYGEATLEEDFDQAVDVLRRVIDLMAGQEVGSGKLAEIERMAREENRVVIRVRPYATFATPPRHVYKAEDIDTLTHFTSNSQPW